MAPWIGELYSMAGFANRFIDQRLEFWKILYMRSLSLRVTVAFKSP